MLARSFRFHGRGSLRAVYEGGKTVRSSQLSLRYRPNPRRSQYRLAVVVAKKVHKSAVVRNRIRRRVYELARQQLPADLAPYDIVVTVFSDKVASMPAPELASAAEQLFKSAGLTRQQPQAATD